MLLIYAEAMIEANKIDASVYDAINQVRQRPGVNMPPVTAGKSQGEMRSVVRKERLYELAMEGFRLSDIRRWKIAEQVIKGGTYSIYTYIPKFSGIAAEMTIIVSDGERTHQLQVHTSDLEIQGQTSGEWIKLGDFRINSNSNASVRIIATGEKSVADAVLFVAN